MGSCMGDHEGWAQPSGFFPNGLLPNKAASVTRVLDTERWLKAEERTAELIACIQPNQPSVGRRNALVDYVQRLIMKCFSCEVFIYGSVPLKTYLPDGDIDLTAFSKSQNLKDTWAKEVRDMLENEEKSDKVEFHVKEVQYIQAEVKIIKCLVENIVVDISFNQLDGLCTLCFLEEVDHLINQNHLFKRSIILIKAWCYYESHILGSRHGLISTYAVVTLVLYIFHVFNNSFTGPLEVLYRFLEFFSNFDWDNFCVSLLGPVPISSLPDMTAEPPRRDGGELLLSKVFLDACSSVYAVSLGGQENQGQAFVSKHFNVIDPFQTNKNLGRSVNKGNFFRIRSAFAFGAKKIAGLLECPEDCVIGELNQFFRNTWDRLGSGHRPDAPSSNIWQSKPLNSEVRNSNSGEVRNSGKVSKNTKTDISITEHEAQGTNHFARTRSGPELTDTSGEGFSRGRRNKMPETGKGQFVSTRPENTNRRRNMGSEISASHSVRSSVDDPSSIRHSSSRQSLNATADSNSVSSSYHEDIGSGAVGEDLASVSETMEMQQELHQEEQDLANMMATSRMIHNFGRQVRLPMNLASAHLPYPVSPSVLASMGYAAPRNLVGMIPANIPLINHTWGSGLQFPQGVISSPLSHYSPGVGLGLNQEDMIDSGSENLGLSEISLEDGVNGFWLEHDAGSTSGLDSDNGSFHIPQFDSKQQSNMGGFRFVPSQVRENRGQHKFVRENRGQIRVDHADDFQYQNVRGNDANSNRNANLRFLPVSQASSSRTKTGSETFGWFITKDH